MSITPRIRTAIALGVVATFAVGSSEPASVSGGLARRAAVGSASVFVPNPVAATGDAGLADADDASAAVPRDAYSPVELEGLDDSGTLTGTYVTTDLTSNRVTSASLDFTNLDRADRGFEEVEAYWAIDRAQRYVRDVLGVAGAADYRIRVDVHAFPEDLSSTIFASDGTSTIRFGDGGVDDAEDAEIVWLQYGYAVFYSQRPDADSPQGVAIASGFADYFAAAMSTTVPGDPRFYATIGEWDATAYSRGDAVHPWPFLRAVDGTKRYPDDLAPVDANAHVDGALWSGALWAVRQAVGGETADRVIVSANALMPADVDFVGAAEAVLEADRRLNGGANAAAIAAAFAEHGIDVDATRVLGVTAAVPATAAPRSTSTVRIIGDRFVDGAKVSFGRKIKVVFARVVSPTEIDVGIKVKNAPVGPRDVVVTNPDGSTATGTAIFRVAAQ